MPTTTPTAAAKTITYKKLASFAPPPVAAALAEQTKKSFTVADVEALAAHFADTEDFDSKSYLDSVLEGLSGGASTAPAQAPRDPITAEAEKARGVSAATQAIEQATGMPAEHASLYADAGFTVDEATRGWKAGLKGGQAFMFMKLGTTVDEAIALGKAKVDGPAAYSLLEARIPAGLVPQFVERGLTGGDAQKFAQHGVFPEEMLQLHDLGIKPDRMPDHLDLEQIKKVIERGLEVSKVESLLDDGLFTFDAALDLLETPAAEEVYRAKRIFETGRITAPELVSLYNDKAMKDYFQFAAKLLSSGVTAAQIHQLAAAGVELDDIVVNNALGSGYSGDEIVGLWLEGLGLKKSNPAATGLDSFYEGGFTPAQLREVGPAGAESYSVALFRKLKLTPAEIIDAARGGYGSYSKFKTAFIDVGIKPKDAVALIRAGE